MMLRDKDQEAVELECPICGALVETTTKEAEKGTVRCPRGHEFNVLGISGGGTGNLQ